MSGKVFGVLMLMTALVLAMNIGADFASYEAQRDVKIAVVADDHELIDLEPGLPYAYISEEDGKLYIDISRSNPSYSEDFGGEGISPDSIYTFDCMFKVSNNLWEDVPIVVTVTSDNENIKVYSNGEADMQTEFTVENGESVCVGMVISGEGYSPGDEITGTLTIKAERGVE